MLITRQSASTFWTLSEPGASVSLVRAAVSWTSRVNADMRTGLEIMPLKAVLLGSYPGACLFEVYAAILRCVQHVIAWSAAFSKKDPVPLHHDMCIHSQAYIVWGGPGLERYKAVNPPSGKNYQSCDSPVGRHVRQ